MSLPLVIHPPRHCLAHPPLRSFHTSIQIPTTTTTTTTTTATTTTFTAINLASPPVSPEANVAADHNEPACGSCPSSDLDLQRRQRPDTSPNSTLASIAPYNPILPCEMEMRNKDGELVVGSAPANPVCVAATPIRITNGFNAPEH
ncbi:hypothetical protein E2C01_005647 [Portunus trituberculatus]|uniref:Uncharacterized protein n=1 Tax=Portunus trituberculatus TaxID=210409 RepID=A0A5B7CVL8_PORTR|nr:hypothetical protein [Portunus trituberculatus]